MRKFISLLERHVLDELAGAQEHRAKVPELKNDKGLVVRRRLERYLRDRGFEHLGDGEYSMVFTQPGTPYALKIYSDACYDGFIKYCKANSSNAFLPRFKGQSLRLLGDYRMVRMELLAPMGNPHTEGGRWTEYRERFRLMTLVSIASNPGDYEIDLTPEQQQLLTTLEDIVRGQGACSIDLHAGNWMLRGDQLVISDPYASLDDGPFASIW